MHIYKCNPVQLITHLSHSLVFLFLPKSPGSFILNTSLHHKCAGTKPAMAFLVSRINIYKCCTAIHQHCFHCRLMADLRGLHSRPAFCFSAAVCDWMRCRRIPLRHGRDLHPRTLEMWRRQGLRGRRWREGLWGDQEDVRSQGQVHLQGHRWELFV